MIINFNPVIMKQKIRFIVLLLAIISVRTYGQEEREKKFYLGFEGGMTTAINPEPGDQWQIRRTAGSSYYDYGYSRGGGLTSVMSMTRFAIKPRFQLLKGYLSISSGVRFTRINSNLMQGDQDDNEFFFLLYNQAGNDTEYLKVKEINQDNDYLTVPLEVSFTPFRYEYMNFYVKLGVESGFLLNTRSDIRFLNATMEPYQQSVFDKVGITPNSRFTNLYSTIGCQLGGPNRVKYHLELYLPSSVLSTGNSSIIAPGSVSGVQLSIEIPLL